jgi:uncharacterized delta-60 repeat protein
VQPGAVDRGFAPGSGVDGIVMAVAAQRNGRIVIGGTIRSVRGAACQGLARLLPNGQADPSFLTGYGFSRFGGGSAEVRAIVVQRDGKIVVGGDFDAYGGVLVNNLCRLNPDGSLDDGFGPNGDGTNGPVNALLLLGGDFKLVIGGDFTECFGQPRARIAALATDGTLEEGLGVGTGFDGPVHALAEETLAVSGLSTAIWAGGDFSDYRGTARARVARLSLLGAVSGDFNPGVGPNGAVRALVTEADGSVIIGGEFTAYKAVNRSRVARLLPNGDLDPAFDPPADTDARVRALLREQQTLLVAGDFDDMGGFAGLARLRLDSGVVDADFAVGAGTGGLGDVRALARQRNGRTLVGGVFSMWDGATSPNLVRLLPSGLRDASLRVFDSTDGAVNAVARQTDGKVLVGGAFTTVGGQARSGLARLLGNGKVDSRFRVGTGFDGGTVNALALLVDGKILVAGSFTSYDGSPAGGLVRLLPDGRRDTDFNPGGAGVSGGSASIFSLKTLLNGDILIAGNFSNYNGTPRGNIARLSSTGGLDATFTTPAGGAAGTIFALAPLLDGSVIIGGDFGEYEGVARARLAKVESNGTLDPNFLPVPGNAGPNNQVRAIQPLLGGDLLVGGFFTTYNGVAVRKLIRISANGSHPAITPFQAPNLLYLGTNIVSSVLDVAVQPDGKILIGGLFDEADRQQVSNIMRLNAVGAADGEFYTRVQTTGLVLDLALEPDGKVLAAGNFTSIDRQARPGVARLAGNYTFSRQRFGGISFRSSLNEQLGARFSMTLTASGVCSGVIAGARRQVFRGRFDPLTGSVTIPLRGVGGMEQELILSLGFSEILQQVLLDIKLNEVGGPQQANILAFQSFGTVPQAEAQVLTGLYTGFFLPGAGINDPPGFGVWNLRVARTGVTRLTGRAADGSVLTMSGLMSTSGEVALHQLLYRRQGYLQVVLSLADQEGRRRLTGSQVWLKRIGASTNFYEDGFVVSSGALAQAWTPPPYTLLGLSFASPNATFTAHSGNLPFFSSPIFINGQNRVTDPGTVENLVFRFNRRTGMITGSFRNPLLVQRTPLPYRLIVAPALNAAAGHLVLRDPATGLVRASLVSVQPAP